MYIRVLALVLVALLIHPSEVRAEFTKHKIAKIVDLMRLKTANSEGRVQMNLYVSDDMLVHVSYQVLAGTNAQPALVIAFDEVQMYFSEDTHDETQTVARKLDKIAIPHILLDFGADGVLDYIVKEAGDLDDAIDMQDEQERYVDLIQEILETLEARMQKS